MAMLRSVVIILLTSLGLMVGACGDVGRDANITERQAGSASDENSLEDLAREEGSFTFYCGVATDPCQALVNRFNDVYPDISVSIYAQPGGVVFERLRTDVARGDHKADVWVHSDIATYLLAINEGMVEPFETEHEFPDIYEVLIPFGYPAWVTTFAVGVNTDLVNEQERQELSSSWDALLDPKWKGRIATADPSQSGSVFNYFFQLKEQMGNDEFWRWLEELSKQEVAIFDSAIPPAEALARGEFAIALSGEHLFSQQVSKGAPVSVAFPEPVPGYIGIIGLPANAPHPNAGKLFIQWFISREGQAAWGEIYEIPSAIPGLESERGITKVAGYKPPTEVFAAISAEQVEKQLAERDEFLARFSQIMGLH